MPIKVRVGQTEAIKILSSKGGGSVSTQDAVNVIGGIASVSQLSVSGVSTFTGIGTFVDDLYVGDKLYVGDDLTVTNDINLGDVLYVTQSGGIQNSGGFTNLYGNTVIGGVNDSLNIIAPTQISGNLNVTGITTISNLYGDGSNLTGISVAGIDTAGESKFNRTTVSGLSTFEGNIDVNANADISGNLVVGGTINSGDNITITKGIPTLHFVDTNSTDYQIRVNNGLFTIRDTTNSQLNRFQIDSGRVYLPDNLVVNQQTNLTNLNVSGVATVSNYLTVSDIRSDALTLKNAGGGASYATFSNGGKATLNWNNTKRLETDTNGVNIVGVLSATQLAGDGQGITNLPPSGHYIQDEGGGISSDAALIVNYVGAGVSATQSGSVCTVTVPAASGVSPQNLFETIAVAGQSNVVADSATDTLTFAAGSNMTITTNASNDTITFASSGGGGGGVDVGITTNLTGTFSGGYGTASAINTYAYSSIDRVFEYTVLIERGSDFQTTKVLAKRSGTTVNATQYAVMYSNNLLAQLDVLILSGEVRLYASPEPGVTGTLTYRIKREVM